MMQRYITEFIGTFFLVLTIGLTVSMQQPLAPVAIGVVLVVMVYMGGHVSGAHFNPAVSLAVFAHGKLSLVDLIGYIVAQLLGGAVAAALVYFLVKQTFAPEPGADVGVAEALAAEIVFTFALVLVILNVALAPKTANNHYYGAAIGLTVMAGAFAVGPISGAALNPSVGIGPAVFRAIAADGSLTHLWIYIVGPLVGGLLAVPIFKLQIR